jgi:hypothetical protein
MALRNVLAITVFTILLSAASLAGQQNNKKMTVFLKDGHQKSFSLSDVSHIDFKDGDMLVNRGSQQEGIPVADILRIEFEATAGGALSLGRNHFLGKWEVGEGVGSAKFTITLEADGQAHKTIGSPHGTWVVVDGEARISWDDGWHDVIRKVGGKHEKFAYEPGKPISDQPSNVTDAKNLNAEPI